MFAVFSIQKGAWKFYAFLSSTDALDTLKKYFASNEVQYVVHDMPEFDIQRINEIQSELNNEK